MLKQKFLLWLFLIAFITPKLTAQEVNNAFRKGTWELSFVGGFSYLATEVDFYYESGTHSYSSYSSNDFCLAVIPAYYLFDAISIEPEVQMTLFENEKPGYSGIIGVSYTYCPVAKGAGIFLKAGAGLSNSITTLSLSPFIVRVTEGFNVKIYKFSSGVKFPVSDDVIIRTELEYKISDFKNDSSSYYSSLENTLSELQVKFGFAVLL